MRRSPGLALTVVAAAALVLSGCVQQDGPTVVTFEVADQGTYKIELVTPEQIQHVKDLGLI